MTCECWHEKQRRIGRFTTPCIHLDPERYRQRQHNRTKQDRIADLERQLQHNRKCKNDLRNEGEGRHKSLALAGLRVQRERILRELYEAQEHTVKRQGYTGADRSGRRVFRPGAIWRKARPPKPRKDKRT